jgi:hypothetical protein
MRYLPFLPPTAVAILAAAIAIPTTVSAVPPFVSGDVPPADPGTFELYSGFEYESFDSEITRGLPHLELIYGLWERQEITFEINNVSEGHVHGFGDIVVGTKIMLVKETDHMPGLSLSYELTLPTASTRRGLGGGTYDHDLLLRTQKSWGWFTLIGNVGHTWLSDAHIPGGREPREDVWFLSVAQRSQLTRNLEFLAEVWWETSETPGEPNRFAGDVGLEYAFADNFKVHGSIGTSLREDQRGGPDIRAYVGFKWEFDAPWRKSEREIEAPREK